MREPERSSKPALQLPAGTEQSVQLFAQQTMSGVCLRSPGEGRGGSAHPGGSQFSHETLGGCSLPRVSELGAKGHHTGPLRRQSQCPPWSLNCPHLQQLSSCLALGYTFDCAPGCTCPRACLETQFHVSQLGACRVSGAGRWGLG